jgi:hypothetical protein
MVEPVIYATPSLKYQSVYASHNLKEGRDGVAFPGGIPGLKRETPRQDGAGWAPIVPSGRKFVWMSHQFISKKEVGTAGN